LSEAVVATEKMAVKAEAAAGQPEAEEVVEWAAMPWPP